jgi:pimeloyl-ACP methyl ester carboxylesterase
VALIDKWIIDYMTEQKLIMPDKTIVVGQSAGGWAALAPSGQNLPAVRAMIVLAAGRGGRVGGKPNYYCAPDKLVAATAEFGRTPRTPNAVDLHRERYLLRTGFIEANAPGLYRGRR